MKKEALKFQKDLIIQLQAARGRYGNFHWAVPEALRGKEDAIKKWMIEQFNTRFVKSRIGPDEFDAALNDFVEALDNGLLQFF